MLNVMFVNGRKTFSKLFSTKLSAYTLITEDKLSFVENLDIIEEILEVQNVLYSVLLLSSVATQFIALIQRIKTKKIKTNATPNKRPN